MLKLFQHIPRFWLLQLLGWSVYAGIDFAGVLPHWEDRTLLVRRAILASHTTFVGGLFLSSFALRFVCRRIWRRNMLWPQSMLWAGLLSGLLGAVPAFLQGWIWNLVQGIPVTGRLLDNSLEMTIYATFVLISWSGVYLGIKHYWAFQVARERAIQAESLAREARLQALRYQLNPHFLFNTLNAISTLVVKEDSAAANQMLVQLAAFLRSTLYGLNTQEIPLHREIDNTKRYLEIEKTRLGEGLKLELLIAPETQYALVPVLFLQPLVENAIRHGIASNPRGGTLKVQTQRIADRVRVIVFDNGIGCPRRSGESGQQYRGVGLANTLERLRILYGPEHQFLLQYPAEGGCHVEIEFPYRQEDLASPAAIREPVTDGEGYACFNRG